MLLLLAKTMIFMFILEVTVMEGLEKLRYKMVRHILTPLFLSKAEGFLVLISERKIQEMEIPRPITLYSRVLAGILRQ